MVNGEDLWGIVHILRYTLDGTSRLRTECDLQDPLRATDEEADCAYCVTYKKRRAEIRAARAIREAELDRLRQDDPDRYFAEREKQWRRR